MKIHSLFASMIALSIAPFISGCTTTPSHLPAPVATSASVTANVTPTVAPAVLPAASTLVVAPAPTIPLVLPKFEDLARHADHSAIYMNQDQAFEYCAAKGSHLPSVREFALWSAAQGAAGIRETAYKDVVYTDAAVKAERELNGKSGFFVVYRQTVDGKMVIDFYYNRNGYKRPAGEIGDTWFWTSSQFPADSGLAFVYDAPAGVVHYGFYHAKWYPVRCVAGR